MLEYIFAVGNSKDGASSLFRCLAKRLVEEVRFPHNLGSKLDELKCVQAVL